MFSIAEIMNGNASSSFYLVDSYEIWHARLGHVSNGYIKKMHSLGLINNIDYSCDTPILGCPVDNPSTCRKPMCLHIMRLIHE